MRILYHHRIASRDGQYLHVTAIVAALEEAGHEVQVVGPAVNDEGDLGGGGGAVAAVRRLLPGFVAELLEFGYNLLAYFRLRSAARRFKPEFIYERYNLFLVAGVWLSRSLKIPLVLEVNAPLFEERCEHGGLSLKRLAKWSERFCWLNAEKVLPVTAVLAEKILAEGAQAERVTVIHNGVDAGTMTPTRAVSAVKAELGLGSAMVLGFVGFVRAWHGLQDVLPILGEDSTESRVMLVVGDGPGRPQIEEEAARLGLSDKVIFTGVVNRSRLADIMQTFDIALQPAVVPYASPLKLFEYMFLGKAIIAPDSANIREIVEDGESALLFEPGNIEEFKNCVARLCNDPELRARLGHGARAAVDARRYYWSDNALKICGLAQSLIVGQQQT